METIRFDNLPVEHVEMYGIKYTDDSMIIGGDDIVINKLAIITVIDADDEYDMRLSRGQVILKKAERKIQVFMR